MDGRLIEEINMMGQQLKVAGFAIDYNLFEEKWHLHLANDGCFVGTSKETHAYLRGALAVHYKAMSELGK